MDTFRLQKITDIPAPPDGYSVIAKSVTNDGSLLFLSIDSKAVGAVRATYTHGIGIFPEPTMKDAKRFRLSILGAGRSLQTIDLPELDITFPRVDLFPDGRILVVGTRCAWRSNDDYDLNGVIFDPKSDQLSRILLGDGINNAYVDAHGRIWVAYFDEGIFGNFGWGHPGPRPVGAAGLVCFSDIGEKIWEFDGDIADCYALNVSESEAAIFFYVDFPICRISSDFKRTYWNTDLRGCHQFALSETKVLCTGQYHDSPDTAYLGTLGTDRLVGTKQIRLVFPDGSAIPKGKFLGRGKHLYFFDEVGVYRASVD